MIGAYMKFSRRVIQGLVDDAKILYSPVIIKGLKFHVPAEYVPCISLSLDFLEVEEASALEVIVGNLNSVYAVPKPCGVGAALGVAFIDSGYEFDSDYPQVWVDLLGYLFHGALVCDFVSKGHSTAVFKWSKFRKICDREEMALKSRLNARRL